MIRNLAISILIAVPLAAQFSFERVELRTGYGNASEGEKGSLQFAPGEIRFLNDDNVELFAIPSDATVKLLYSSVEGRGTPLSKPFDLLSGKKHFFTISFEQGPLIGAVEFKLHKSNHQSIVRNAELLTGLKAERDRPTQQVAATPVPAKAEPPARAVIEILSTPQGAEVEINDSFNGLTPRRKSVEAGQYRIAIKKDGYETFERVVMVDPGQTLEVHGELRQLSATAR